MDVITTREKLLTPAEAAVVCALIDDFMTATEDAIAALEAEERDQERSTGADQANLWADTHEATCRSLQLKLDKLLLGVLEGIHNKLWTAYGLTQPTRRTDPSDGWKARRRDLDDAT